MADGWDGRPEHPERDGWHLLKHKDEAEPKAWRYRPGFRHLKAAPGSEPTPWLEPGCGVWSERNVVWRRTYLGPLYTADELAAARREGAEAMRTRAAAACLRRAHASAEDDLTPIEEAVRDEAIYCARAIRALEIEG